MYKNNTIIALVPMKGHSERVPNKNMRLFGQAPLYHRIINTLLKVEYIDEIIVNTDSELLASDISMNFPMVKIHNRPKEIQGDYVSMNDIISYDMNLLNCKHFLQTHSTNPLLKAKTVKQSIINYFEDLNKYDSLFTVTKLQTRLYDAKGLAVNHNPKELIRTQDLEPLYEENSNLFVFSKDSFKNNDNKRIGKIPQMFEMDKIEAMDIDEEVDFILAEFIYEKLYKDGKEIDKFKK